MSDTKPNLFEGVEATPGAAKPDPIIVADGITRQFGGLTAVDVKHFEAQRHAITALIGPNGAGKSTFFNLLTSFDTPNSGSAQFNAVEPGMPDSDVRTIDLGGMSSANVARAGMVRTFQLTKALNRMSVMENMRLGAQHQSGENVLNAMLAPLWRKREQEITEQAESLLERFKLLDKQDDYAGSLSGGQRKLLEMARALMSKPSMIMLDEPMAGVNPALTESLLDHIVGLKEDGVTVLFVEHDMHMVRRISDWVVVMAEGKIIAEGDPHEVMANQAVQDAYLGSHHDTNLFEER
ncbi:ABC transporter ATP-binding protein [Demequina aurantiaca]|uniref:ABC transporter ATP-binding protein n=1 Tax=Demequina aurantiaca TaxID=676200 RepID=UPI000780A369|nr:ABC transporter ATP-binding protein [Demequina aurantiaca]